MKYQVIGYSTSNVSPGGSVLTPIVQIDKTRYDSVEKCKQTCLLAIGFEERFQLIIDNFFEWEVELLTLAESSLLWRSIDRAEAMQKRLRLDRRLVNLLTVCRLYLDQTDHGLSQSFGNPSPELTTIKNFKRRIYDENFGYRFIEALRNYVQHCGLPVHIFAPYETLASPFNGMGPLPPVQISVVPRLRLDIVKADWPKKSVLKEAISGGKEIDLRVPVRNYLDCITRLHAKLRETYAKVFAESRETYLAAAAEYATLDGHAVQCPKLQCCVDSGVVENEIELPPEIFTVYDALYSRNSKVDGVSTKFVSSAIAKRD